MHRDARRASGLAAILVVALTACGPSGSEDANAGDAAPASEKEQLQSMADQVDAMKLVEWQGQLLTSNPDSGGKQIFQLTGRYDPASGATTLAMDSVLDGESQQVDYIVMNDRTYFNSDAWGAGAASCYVDITGDASRSWALPQDLDPRWSVSKAKAVKPIGSGVSVDLPGARLMAGLPRGLFENVPAAVDKTKVRAIVKPHGPLVEVAVDVAGMWGKVPSEALAGFDTRRSGWWAVTMRESTDGSSIAAPEHVFDPKVTPPTQCKRA